MSMLLGYELARGDNLADQRRLTDKYERKLAEAVEETEAALDEAQAARDAEQAAKDALERAKADLVAIRGELDVLRARYDEQAKQIESAKGLVRTALLYLRVAKPPIPPPILRSLETVKNLGE